MLSPQPLLYIPQARRQWAERDFFRYINKISLANNANDISDTNGFGRHTIYGFTLIIFILLFRMPMLAMAALPSHAEVVTLGLNPD